MNIGLKLWSTNDFYIKPAAELFEQNVYDYIELFIVPDSIDYLRIWKALDIPFVLHAPHSLSGLNPAQKNCEIRNFQLVLEIEEFRKSLKPDFIIFHPGLNGSLHETANQFNRIGKDYPELHNKMLVENKPKIGLNGENCMGSTANEIKKIIEGTGIEFCLDLGHAICAANSKNIKWNEFISDFLLLKPKMFHLSDGDICSEKDHHANFGKGSFPLIEILKLLPENAKITIETEKSSKNNLDDFEQDVAFLKEIF